MNDITIPKHLLLNWLYSTDKAVSIDKLAAWLEHKPPIGGSLKRHICYNDKKMIKYDDLIIFSFYGNSR
jgi:hypothetical protein